MCRVAKSGRDHIFLAESTRWGRGPRGVDPVPASGAEAGDLRPSPETVAEILQNDQEGQRWSHQSGQGYLPGRYHQHSFHGNATIRFLNGKLNSYHTHNTKYYLIFELSSALRGGLLGCAAVVRLYRRSEWPHQALRSELGCAGAIRGAEQRLDRIPGQGCIV